RHALLALGWAALTAAGCSGAQAIGDATSRDASLCRCPPRSLAAYYDAASEVTLARLTEVREAPGERRLQMELVARPWRHLPDREPERTIGDAVTYASAPSTAECGIVAQVGAVYLVFAQPPSDPRGLPRVDTCSGTRIFRGPEDDAPEDFEDVPGRFVVSTLDALSGLDELRAVAEQAPAEGDLASEVLIGLLELPPLATGGVVPVRPRPDSTARPSLEADRYTAFESLELYEEARAAVVVAESNGWFRVRLADGTHGWVAPEDSGPWYPYAALPIRRLTYLTTAWSGHVWPGPGAGNPIRSPLRWSGTEDEFPVEVLESTVVGGVPWFRIEVLAEDPCRGGDGSAALAGWVPAYGDRGDVTVWYYSRGC